MSFWEANRDHFVNAGVSVLVLMAAWATYWLLRHMMRRFSRRHSLPQTDPGTETRLHMIERLMAVVIFLVAVGLVFWIMEVDALKRVAAGIFASAGVAGIILGFAAQAPMANLASGVMIAFAQPVRLGDDVEIDGEYGRVESIGLFYTQIRVWDNRRLVIPNKVLADRTIRNYTLVDPRMPALVVLRLEYGADLDAVRAVLLREAGAHPLSLKAPPPSVQVIDADDLGVSVRLTAWAAEQSDAWTLAVDLRESVVKGLAAAEMPIGVRWSRVLTEPESA
ncbi:MAG: mechanosensitive ion channel [Thermoleophilia bacterium]|nr:mechanosensitive ion channel [Thermoleophilia bacterium]